MVFDGSASSDPDGSIASYSWDFGDGSYDKGRTVRHTYTSAREFEAQLTVADNKGKEDAQIHPVEVVKPNKVPVPRFSFTPKQGEFPLKISFDASASSDPDGSIAAYAWDFGDGKFGTGRTASHTYTWAGTFTIKLKVTDDRGKTADKTEALTVIKPNDMPLADFGFSPSGGFYPIDILFDGTASVDPDGTIVSYAWEFGDGETSTAAQPLHRFKSWGTYAVKLTVVDDRNGVARRTKSVVVLRLLQPLNIRWTTIVDEGLWALTHTPPEVKYEVAKMPPGLAGSKVATSNWPNLMFIPAGAKHPKEGWMLTAYFATEGQYEWWDRWADVPVWKAFPEDRAPKDLVARVGQEKAIELTKFTRSCLPDVVVQWNSPVDDYATDELSRAIDQVLHKATPPEQALKKAQEMVTAKLQEVTGQ